MAYFSNTGNGILFFFLCFFISCNTEKSPPATALSSAQHEAGTSAAEQLIRDKKILVQTGDLIMRSGNDFTSDFMRGLSRTDKAYSHAGIASIENDTLFVYHAMGGEWNPDKTIRRDRFELFCNPKENRGFGIYRYALNDIEREQFLKNIQTLYLQKIPFDLQFDLSSDDSLYCTEFIYKAAINLLPIASTTFGNFEFIAPDNLYLIDGCERIEKFQF